MRKLYALGKYGWNTETRANGPTRLECGPSERFHRSLQKKAGEKVSGMPEEVKDQKNLPPQLIEGTGLITVGL
jgi:hypothetical protein